MKSVITVIRQILLLASLGWSAQEVQPAFAQTNGAIRIVEVSGVVEILPHGASDWVRTAAGQELHPPVRVRTRANSSVGVLLSDQSVLRFPAMSELEILPPTSGEGHGLQLLQGILSFFHRDKPGRIRVITSGGVAGVEGTEFVMALHAVNGVEQTTLSVIDGTVRFSNAGVSRILTNGEQAVSEPGQPPRRTPGFIAKNILQWCFYYPGVLDPDELQLTAAETSELAESLADYRAGDLLAALAKYPANRPPGSDAERIYLAALELSAGEVELAETNLAPWSRISAAPYSTGRAALAAAAASSRPQRLAHALRTLVAAVKREPRPATLNPELATEFLANSYYEQSLAEPKSLEKALALARRAATNSPNFGFARERVAELEFSFGRTDRAWKELQPALRLSPRNAQALALKGFLLAAQNKTRAAIGSFDDALAVDAGLGNAWLGRGLCRIRRGETKTGREDLLIAAAMEPERATLRSYLGKAFANAGDFRRAWHELSLAKHLDPNDPTAWLYSALLNEDQNRINEAVSDLEKSEALNNNRRVYRSGLLLDEDRAVRSANLARIYDEAGLTDVGLDEANRAVEADYANYSAHLFLANTYDRLRQESPVDLRYETPAYSEYLLASLLGPADGRTLAQPVSQEQYISLLERDGPGIFSSIEYLSRGAFDQYAAQFGTFKDTSYAAEEEYAYDPGELPNQNSTTHSYSFKIKQALTPKDQVFGQVTEYENNGGYLPSVYSAAEINPSFRFEERQEPDLLVGYHRAWAPGQDTLFLLSRFHDNFNYSVTNTPALLEIAPPIGQDVFKPTAVNTLDTLQENIYSAELQQIWQTTWQSLIVGGRGQWGDASAGNLQANVSQATFVWFPYPAFAPAAEQAEHWNFSRYNFYAYEHWHIFDFLTLIGGVSYDRLTLPLNDNSPPLNADLQTQHQFSPKAGFVWTPAPSATIRGAFTRSLGGFNLDQSLRLEPTEVAGFVQGYRSLIPESLAGALGGAKFETFDLAYEQTLPRRTYLTLGGEVLYSSLDHDTGVFEDEGPYVFSAAPASLRQHLQFTEWSADAAVHQLIGRDFSLGADYRVSHARLLADFPGLTAAVDSSAFQQSVEHEGLLQSLVLQATFNHPSGCFAQLQGRWTAQDNFASDSLLAGDNFWQFDALAGYRFPRRRAVLSVGLLNFTGQNYHLNPVNLYLQLPRAMTFVCKFQVSF